MSQHSSESERAVLSAWLCRMCWWMFSDGGFGRYKSAYGRRKECRNLTKGPALVFEVTELTSEVQFRMVIVFSCPA